MSKTVRDLESVTEEQVDLMNEALEIISDLPVYAQEQIKILSLMQNNPDFGFVYFLENLDNSLIKVGYTSNLQRRVKELGHGVKMISGANPNFKLKGLVFAHNRLLPYIESDYHDYLKEYKKFGEWFDIPKNEYFGVLFDGETIDLYVEDVPVIVNDSQEFHLYDKIKVNMNGVNYYPFFSGKGRYSRSIEIFSYISNGIASSGYGLKIVHPNETVLQEISYIPNTSLSINEYKKKAFSDGEYVQIISNTIADLSSN